MKRIAFNSGVAVVTFSLGLIASTLISLSPRVSRTRAPLLVTISRHDQEAGTGVHFDHNLITVMNIGTRTIRGYSLGHTCGCATRDERGYPDGINYTIPVPDLQLLRPGESQTMPMPFENCTRKVWIDLVHFENGGNWGPNRSHQESYVRE